MKGIAEMEELFGYLASESLAARVELDLSLARGLNYYTGAIIEVKADDAVIGSICGGGRYDDLTGIFGLPGVSGVGVSFGADRIYDVMLQLGLFPEAAASGTKVLVINFGGKELSELVQITRSLRDAGISSELYPDVARLKKQFAYADARRIPWVIIAGSEELAAGQVTVKEMRTGGQQKIDLSALADFIKAERH
jgi:histidyl-tRNA synthetase